MSVCQRSLAEFADGSRQIKLNHFLPGRVPGRKYFSGRKCAPCAPMAHKACARRAAKVWRKTPFGVFRQAPIPLPVWEGNCYARSHLQMNVRVASAVYWFSIGKATWMQVPAPGWLVRLMAALWSRAACFTMDRPRPVPPTSLERLLSTR